RAYRGFCRAPQQVISTLAAFREKKDDIYTLVRAQPDLQPLTIKKTVSYLDAFYRTIDKPGQLRRRILESCR
ncbi:MAG: hypothetical protein KJO35_07820, partial [Gammaproteobacteria bacterium]|nr:hypothetical protein [Gammaproteobacteria bacterium]